MSEGDKRQGVSVDPRNVLEHEPAGLYLENARSNARLHILAEASRAFAMVVTDYPSTIQEIARVVTDLVGDGCLVTLLGDDGDTLRNAASAHRDAELEATYRAYVAQTPLSRATSPSVSATVARTGQSKHMSEVSPGVLVAQAEDDLKPIVAKLNVHSFVVVPIRARKEIIGTLSLLRSHAGHGYTPDDVTLLEDLAHRAGLAIENARLYAGLEKRVQQRTAELEAANKELEAFSHTIAQALRPPLRNVGALSGTLVEECAGLLSGAQLKDLKRIHAAAQRMTELVDRLFGARTMTSLTLRRGPADLSAAAAAVLGRLRENDPRRAVAASVEPGLAADADARLVEIALSNLVGDAWRATEARTDARLEVGARGARPTVFFVRDNREGFDVAQATKAIGAVDRSPTDADVDATATALITARRMVQRHGGRIWAERAAEGGAVVCFTLEPASK